MDPGAVYSLVGPEKIEALGRRIGSTEAWQELTQRNVDRLEESVSRLWDYFLITTAAMALVVAAHMIFRS